MGKHFSKTTINGEEVYKCAYCERTEKFMPVGTSEGLKVVQSMRDHVQGAHQAELLKAAVEDEKEEKAEVKTSAPEEKPQVEEPPKGPPSTPRKKEATPSPTEQPPPQPSTEPPSEEPPKPSNDEELVLMQGEEGLDEIKHREFVKILDKLPGLEKTKGWVRYQLDLNHAIIRDPRALSDLLARAGLKPELIYTVIDNINFIDEKYRQYVSSQTVIQPPHMRRYPEQQRPYTSYPSYGQQQPGSQQQYGYGDACATPQSRGRPQYGQQGMPVPPGFYGDREPSEKDMRIVQLETQLKNVTDYLQKKEKEETEGMLASALTKIHEEIKMLREGGGRESDAVKRLEEEIRRRDEDHKKESDRLYEELRKRDEENKMKSLETNISSKLDAQTRSIEGRLGSIESRTANVPDAVGDGARVAMKRIEGSAGTIETTVRELGGAAKDYMRFKAGGLPEGVEVAKDQATQEEYKEAMKKLKEKK